MRRTSILVLISAMVAVLAVAGSAGAQEAPEFRFGFQTFAGLVPDVVGQPLENERHDLIGNGFQQTTNGLLVWHKLDNVVDFTNGFLTFILAPQGLLQRDNGQRFQFEIVREQLEAQLEAQIEQQPDQADALFEQFQQQLELLEEQLEQPEALVEVQPEQVPGPTTFRVTVENFTNGQPFSPPVAATHGEGIRLFQEGAMASDELADVARDGNAVPLFSLVNGAPGVTQAVTIAGIPPTRSASFEIQALPGDLFSMATMLSCTNDGFTGLDSVALPESGTLVISLFSWDAGREDNTEVIEDLVDQCGIPFGTPGRRNAEVATTPPQPIVTPHPGILGVGDLDPSLVGWVEPVGSVTIERVGP